MPARNADAHGHLRQPFLVELLVECIDTRQHQLGRIDGAIGLVGEVHRCTPEGHQSVAGVAIERALQLPHRCCDAFQKTPGDGCRGLQALIGGDLRVIRHVGHQHGDVGSTRRKGIEILASQQVTQHRFGHIARQQPRGGPHLCPCDGPFDRNQRHAQKEEPPHGCGQLRAACLACTCNQQPQPDQQQRGQHRDQPAGLQALSNRHAHGGDQAQTGSREDQRMHHRS